MEPLDPKAELMRLVYDNARAYSEWNDDATAQTKAAYVAAMAALESAITLALAAERRRALEDALNPRRWSHKMNNAWHRELPDTYAAFKALLNLLVDGKAGGT